MKKKITGILSVDPSWLGFAVCIFIPELYFYEAKVYDISKGNYKKNSDPTKSINSVYGIFTDLFSQFGDILLLIDVFVIEHQFVDKMKRLCYISESIIRTLFGLNVKIFKISALVVKRHFNIELQKNHYYNKLEAVKFVNDNKSILIGAEYINTEDDNICDSLLLANCCLSKKKLNFRTEINTEMDDGECDNCGEGLVRKECGNGANQGRWYIACPNGNSDNPACKKAFRWAKPATGKRTNIKVETSSAKKKVPDSGASVFINHLKANTEALNEIITVLKKIAANTSKSEVKQNDFQDLDYLLSEAE